MQFQRWSPLRFNCLTEACWRTKVQSVETSFWNQVVYHAGHTHTTDAPIQSSICLEIALVWSSLHKLYSLQGPSHERKCPASQKHSFVLTTWFQHNSTAIEKRYRTIVLQIFTVIIKVLYPSHLEIFFPLLNRCVSWPIPFGIVTSSSPALDLRNRHATRFVVRQRMRRWPSVEKLHLLITNHGSSWQKSWRLRYAFSVLIQRSKGRHFRPS